MAVAAIILVLSLLSAVLSTYMAWSNVGSEVIEGLQGRYLLPLAPLLFVPLYNNRSRIRIDIYWRFITIYCLWILGLALYGLANGYYL